ncbi:DMT family transporter [uncultured Algimonas sp.]|uniref:DMT family transporter n=1 Tax=uncultured Algimonas sp. TaxID=1547920 RepID=UPI0026157854|nr:DMT family transporter [uncultured Algimonas sp.]
MKSSFREVQGAAALNGSDPRLDGAGIALGMIGAVLFSMKAILVKMAYDVVPDLPAVTLMVLRMGLSLPAYVLILLIARRAGEGRIGTRETLAAMAAGVLAYYVCTFLDFQGLKYITAQLERLLLFTYPAFVVIFGALFFGGRITRAGLASVVLAYGGLAVVFLRGDITQSDNLWLGAGLILLCAALFALFQLIAKGFIDRIGARVFTCLAMIGAATALFLHFFVSSGGPAGMVAALRLPREMWVIAAALAVFCTLVPSFFINIAIGRIGAQAVAILGMVGPLATIVAAIVVLGEPFGLWDGIGTAITLLGIGLYTYSSARSKRERPRQT